MTLERQKVLGLMVGLLLAVVATVSPAGLRAVCALLAGLAIPAALVTLGLRRLGFNQGGAIGLAVMAVLAYWSLVTFGLLAVGVGPSRVAALGVCAVLVLVAYQVSRLAGRPTG